MIDDKNVIDWLKNCDGHAIHTGHGCEKCPFLEGTESGEECIERLHAAAYELLGKLQRNVTGQDEGNAALELLKDKETEYQPVQTKLCQLQTVWA